jgi:hypothetical protein
MRSIAKEMYFLVSKITNHSIFVGMHSGSSNTISYILNVYTVSRIVLISMSIIFYFHLIRKTNYQISSVIYY